MKKSGHSQDVAFKESCRIGGQTWAGMEHGSSFVGHLPVSLGAFAYQCEGNRLFACIDAMDLISSMPDMPAEVTPEMGPDIIKVSGLCCDSFCVLDSTTTLINLT